MQPERLPPLPPSRIELVPNDGEEQVNDANMPVATQPTTMAVTIIDPNVTLRAVANIAHNRMQSIRKSQDNVEAAIGEACAKRYALADQAAKLLFQTATAPNPKESFKQAQHIIKEAQIIDKQYEVAIDQEVNQRLEALTKGSSEVHSTIDKSVGAVERLVRSKIAHDQHAIEGIIKQEHARTEDAIKQKQAKTEEIIKQEHARTEDAIKQEHAQTENAMKQEHARTEDAIKQIREKRNDLVLQHQQDLEKLARKSDEKKTQVLQAHQMVLEQKDREHLHKIDEMKAKEDLVITRRERLKQEFENAQANFKELEKQFAEATKDKQITYFKGLPPHFDEKGNVVPGRIEYKTASHGILQFIDNLPQLVVRFGGRVIDRIAKRFTKSKTT